MKSNNTPLRFGIVGAGRFVEVCHAPGLQSHPGAELVALCSRTRSRCEEVAARLGIPRTYTDYEELIARPEIDAITICTPNVSHHPIAMAAFRAGKHVFCEKPLAMTLREAAEMWQAARASGCIHHVAFTFRYTHCLAEMRRRIRAGEIGRPYLVRVRGEGWGDLRPTARVEWRHRKELAGAGMLADMGSHYFDLVHWVLEPIGSVCARLLTVPRTRSTSDGESVAVNTDDLAQGWFQTRSGHAGEFYSSRVTPAHGETGYFEVLGEEGALMTFPTRGNREELRLLRPGRPEEPLPLPPSPPGEPHALGKMMRAFVDAILRGHSDGDLDPSFEDGWRVQCVIDAVTRSDTTQRWEPVPDGRDAGFEAV
jgi:predicted dehydrogenase